MKRATGLAIVGAVMIASFGGCGASDDKKLDDARREGQRDEKIKELQRQIREKKQGAGQQSTTTTPTTTGSAGSSPAPTSGPTSCGNGLSAGPGTSCPFASSVRESYPGSSAPFEVFSSVTKKSYSMSCTTNSPHVCRGGNNASVFFP